MNTKVLMNLSAAWMVLVGIVASFMPQELLVHFRADGKGIGPVLVQVLGAAYLGFAMLNWMARENLIGGIYSRPVAMGNFVHFVVAALALVKFISRTPADRGLLLVFTLVYAIFALCFGRVVFTHPLEKRES